MNSLKNYIINLLSTGRYFFSKSEALTELGLNQIQFKYQSYRLSNKGILKGLAQDFFMIISAEYYHLGSLPPHWIIDAYMKHLNQEYYIALLSAASMYGSTQQQPMIFQVITDKTTRAIKLKRGKIEFRVDKNCLSASKTTIKAPTGFVKISTREQTAIDLIRFYKSSGHLSNVSSVIKTLAEGFKAIVFAQVIKHEKSNPVLQRLGYILERSGHFNFADQVEKELLNRKIKYVSLRTDSTNKLGTKNIRWKLIINDKLEFE